MPLKREDDTWKLIPGGVEIYTIEGTSQYSLTAGGVFTHNGKKVILTCSHSWGGKGTPVYQGYSFLGYPRRIGEVEDWEMNSLVDALIVKLDDEDIASFKIYERLPGDVNQDGKVDIIDLASVGLAYWSTPGSPYWKNDTDLVPPYGKIDIFDLACVGLNYGEEVHVSGIPPFTPYKLEPPQAYFIPKGIIEPQVGMIVQKSGVKTNFTRGIIVDVDYDFIGEDGMLMKHQILVRSWPDPNEKFVDKGDSGSLLIDGETHKIVGLLYSGGGVGEFGIACRIKDVMETLNIKPPFY